MSQTPYLDTPGAAAAGTPSGSRSAGGPPPDLPERPTCVRCGNPYRPSHWGRAYLCPGCGSPLAPAAGRTGFRISPVAVYCIAGLVLAGTVSGLAVQRQNVRARQRRQVRIAAQEPVRFPPRFYENLRQRERLLLEDLEHAPRHPILLTRLAETMLFLYKLDRDRDPAATDRWRRQAARYVARLQETAPETAAQLQLDLQEPDELEWTTQNSNTLASSGWSQRPASRSLRPRRLDESGTIIPSRDGGPGMLPAPPPRLSLMPANGPASGFNSPGLPPSGSAQGSNGPVVLAPGGMLSGSNGPGSAFNGPGTGGPGPGAGGPSAGLNGPGTGPGQLPFGSPGPVFSIQVSPPPAADPKADPQALVSKEVVRRLLLRDQGEVRAAFDLGAALEIRADAAGRARLPDRQAAEAAARPLREQAAGLYLDAAGRTPLRIYRATFYYAAAHLYRLLGDWERNYRTLKLAVDAEPTSATLWRELQAACLRMQRFEESFEAGEQVQAWTFPGLRPRRP